MFLIMLTYLQPLTVVDQHLAAHREFLTQGYEKNYFIASGPRNPRSGGIILSQLKDRQQLEAFLANDPYQLNGIAHYEIIEFDAVKYHPNFASFI